MYCIKNALQALYHSQVLGVFVKGSHSLFIGTQEIVWNPQRFPTTLDFSRNAYTNAMYMICPRVLQNSL